MSQDRVVMGAMGGYARWLAVAALAAGCSTGNGTPDRAPGYTDPIEAVDPFIGSGGGGFGQPQSFVGATVPFGMVKPGPDTEGGPIAGEMAYAHTAGYWYYDDTIIGFSQLHFHGTGMDDYGNLPLMPTLGMDASKTNKDGVKQKFSHSDEEAEPGYYAVRLADGVRVELTATEHAAFHRYTFPTGSTGLPTVVIDVVRQIGGYGVDGLVSISNTQQFGFLISGQMQSGGSFTGKDRAFPVYFAIRFTVAPQQWGVWENGTLNDGGTQTEGEKIGAYVQFPSGTTAVEARIGLSYIDGKTALANLMSAGASLSFDDIRRDANELWRKALSVIEVWGGTEADRRMFYTSLYHAMMMPTLMSESDGRYVGLDRQVHDTRTDGGARYYSDMSLWDTYRTEHPLLTLIEPDRAAEFAQTLVRMARHHGAPPRWPLAVNETGTMLGSPASIVFADTVLKGVEGFDIEDAFAYMVSDADGVAGHTIRGGDMQACLQYGFCPSDRVGDGVSKTMEYGWADWAIGNLAHHLGKDEVAARFYKRANGWYRPLWDGQQQFFRGKNSDGNFTDGFTPTKWMDDYREGDAWQYLWEVPWDVPGLSSLFGGTEAMLGKLDLFFELSRETPSNYILGNQRGPDPYYWHGNEPDIHAAYLYALAGQPQRGLQWLDWVRRSKYNDGPDGLDGNDDAGTLSSWYVFTTLGFYPLAGSDRYIAGVPLWRKATLHLPGGDLTIELNGPAADYGLAETSVTERATVVFPPVPDDVQFWINGQPVTETTFPHASIASGGRLSIRAR